MFDVIELSENLEADVFISMESQQYKKFYEKYESNYIGSFSVKLTEKDDPIAIENYFIIANKTIGVCVSLLGANRS